MKNIKNSGQYLIRGADQDDIPGILNLFADEVQKGLMLPRSEEEIRSNIHHWRVSQFNDEIIGCVSLVFFNEKLCEIRSLAVAKSFRMNGLGKIMVEEALILAEDLGAREVLTLTRAPSLFELSGFQADNINNFPEKVRQDCNPCPFVNECDEIALLYSFKDKGLD